MDLYRTFIGLPLKVSETCLETRLELIRALSGERISWVDPLRFHITLRFLGDTRIADINQIGATLLEQMAVPGRFQLQMSQIGSFGPRKKPRVIWIGFEPSQQVEMVKQQVDTVLQSCGIAHQDHAFRAHLTLGRIRSLNHLSGFYATMSRFKNRVDEQVIAERLVFYRSKLGEGGPEYIPLYQLEFNEACD